LIFIILGSQKFQFNRLLKEVDVLIEEGVISEEVFAQSGYSDYIPKNYKYDKFLDRESFNSIIDKSNIVITHGGTGAIVNSVKKKKKVIGVPRLAKYGEHVDNHQLEIIEMFKEANLIYGINQCEELKKALEEIKIKDFSEYKSNTENIIACIEEFILANSNLMEKRR
jgi:UDP-N-acetylglucosamine transferase subunit ALG13